MTGQDSFKPSQGMQVKVMGQAAGPQLGQSPVGRTNGQQVQVQMQQSSVSPMHQQAPIGSANTPKGAQPVALMGQMNATLGSPMAPPTPKLPLSPQGSSGYLSQDNTSDMDVHTITAEGQGPDGKKYVASYDAFFPRGTKILGVTDKVN